MGLFLNLIWINFCKNLHLDRLNRNLIIAEGDFWYFELKIILKWQPIKMARFLQQSLAILIAL